MMMTTRMNKSYFKWLCDLVYDKNSRVSYKKLLEHLYNTEFTWVISRDGNRAEDGLDLRKKYFEYCDVPDHPCSILEMMIALSVRCEEQIMTDDRFGNRTGEWFWNMILSLKLNKMNDTNYNPNYVDECLFIFTARMYGKDGYGGLFTISNPMIDMRTMEIWYQMQWYLNEVLE